MKKSIKDIPIGDYCYEVVDIVKIKGKMPIIKVKQCPYLRFMLDAGYNEERNYCLFCESFDILLDDQCKICDVNDLGDTEVV